MSEKLGLGKLITSEQHRDAIHVAVVPIEAGMILYPGHHVGVEDGKASVNLKHIGVVDPFLKDIVQEGEKFWLFLYPGSITSLRHEWLHPAFDNVTDPKSESEKWLRKFCEDNPEMDYDEMISELQKEDGYIVQNGSESARDIGITEEFRRHFKNVTGVEPKGFFSCSC